MKKKINLSLPKDIARFGASSIMIGSMSSAVGNIGGNAAGLGAVSNMMSPVGTLMMTGHTVKMLSKAMPKSMRLRK